MKSEGGKNEFISSLDWLCVCVYTNSWFEVNCCDKENNISQIFSRAKTDSNLNTLKKRKTMNQSIYINLINETGKKTNMISKMSIKINITLFLLFIWKKRNTKKRAII